MIRNYTASITYHAKGNRYELTKEYRVTGSSCATAAQRALNQCKKQKDFREAAGSRILVQILVGSAANKGEADEQTVRKDQV